MGILKDLIDQLEEEYGSGDMQSLPLEDVQEPEAPLPVVIASDGRGDVALRRTGPMIAPLAAPEERRRRGRPSQSRKKIAAGPDSLPPPPQIVIVPKVALSCQGQGFSIRIRQERIALVVPG